MNAFLNMNRPKLHQTLLLCYVRIMIVLLPVLSSIAAQEFTVARIQYSGGGDWYSDPSSLPNLLNYLSSRTFIKSVQEEVRIKLTDKELTSYPYLYMTGHGNVRFSEEEIIILREFLLRGSFLHADDNYGMDNSFRREMKKVFPDKEWVELPPSHLLFNIYFKFDQGIPKIHEHNNKRPQALALFHEGEIIALYTYESDLGDGWEDKSVHNNPELIRNEALKMGTNIILYSLSR